MNFINALMTMVTQWVLLPLRQWPLVALLLVSAVTGVLMTWVFRFASNQEALGTVVDRSRGHVLAIKLFKDDLPGMFRSLFQVFRLVFARLWYSVFPILVMIVPLLLLLAQLALRYEYRPLETDESAIVELQLTPDAWLSYQGARLETNDGIAIETAALRDESQHAVFWRVKPTANGLFTLRWEMGPATAEKQLVASQGQELCAVSRRRAGPNWFDRLLNPGEPAFHAFAPVKGIVVHYPHRATPLFGWDIPWWLTFFIVSIVVAMLMQPVLKVRF